MSVIASRKDKKLFLEINEGDLEALDQAIEKWELKDIQSYWRLCGNLLDKAEDSGLWIESDGGVVKRVPAKYPLKKWNLPYLRPPEGWVDWRKS